MTSPVRWLRRWWDRRPGGRLEAVPPWDLALARREAEELGQGEDKALWDNACLVARALRRRGKRVYPSGEAVVEALSPARIEELARRWAQGAGRQGYAIQDLKEELEALPWQRLRWRVLRQFGALPTEERARAMTDGDYLWCAVNLLLDEEEAAERLCPVCREEVQAARCPVCGRETGQVSRGENPAFDWERFARMKRGERP